ncbi:uncharacterized protein LOC126800640 [Argentina anserina]|uniref:uncharacterized protein LOC126800640 n=1 Tax=Argentina anserina TaxID=57926 RepID=UPI0021767346|nr:uncharacterized protein LOC126800640 [Potentilla anserina]
MAIKPLPSAPVVPADAYDDEEEKQVDMAIRASLNATNLPSTSSSLSMNLSYACNVHEEERQIDMAIRVSLQAPNFPRASSRPRMNPSYGQEWSSYRFDSGSGSTSSHSQQPQMPSAQQIPNHSRRESVECGVCYEVSMPAICDPCGHVYCYECLLQIQRITNRCPRCRRVIDKVMRIYI